MLREQLLRSNGSSNHSGSGEEYIEHRVSKLDTLAGVAIKYGVEVADVRRVNGLVTDLQMFAHNTLKIPLPGKHLPSTTLPKVEGPSISGSHKKDVSSPNFQLGTTQKTENRYKDKRPLSSAMNLLRGYYGLSSPGQQTVSGIEGMEMTSYRSDSEDHSEDEPFSPITKPAISLDNYVIANGPKNMDVRKAKEISRVGNESLLREEIVPKMGMGDVDKSSERSVRRRSKVEAMNSTIGSSEVENKQDTGMQDRVLPSTVFSSGTESSSRSTGVLGAFVGGKVEKVATSKVMKSSSTPNLQDQPELQADSGGSKYGPKVDIKSANQTSLNLFEGLSKPIGHRYKAALD